MKQNVRQFEKSKLFKGLVVAAMFTIAYLNLGLSVNKEKQGTLFGTFSLEVATKSYGEDAKCTNGTPLMSNGTLFCCANAGTDCCAACC